ncbi:MAG: hypothetical protein FJ125_07960, partial [Deltaproteobacteria bacterium]|nr:hypothetical protein [Deltaproteobacteria bacterium]
MPPAILHDSRGGRGRRVAGRSSCSPGSAGGTLPAGIAAGGAQMSWSLPIRLAAAALVLLGAPWLPMARADYRQATLKDFADIYSGPGEDYYVVEDGEEGNSFPVLQEKGEWVKIRLSTGTGWVEASKVEITTVEGEELPPAAGERAEEGAATEQGAPGGGIEAVVKVKTAKLLSEPSSSAIVVKKLPKGSRVEVVERSRDGKWYKVRYDGPIAWLLASSVRL